MFDVASKCFLFFSVGIEERPSFPPPVPVEVDAGVDDLRLSAPTSPPCARTHIGSRVLKTERSWGRCAHIGGGLFGRERAEGIARTPTAECFDRRESGALRAHRWQSVSEGGREGELGASRAFQQRSVSEGETWGRYAHRRR